MKRICALFLVLCLCLCALPLAGMAVRPTGESTENRVLASFPQLLTARGLNTDFLHGLENYFNDHFAFRNELVFADALIQARVFRVSANEKVVLGRDGWLYYTSTLGDYQGSALLSPRDQYNLTRHRFLPSTPSSRCRSSSGRGGSPMRICTVCSPSSGRPSTSARIPTGTAAARCWPTGSSWIEPPCPMTIIPP